MAKRILITSTSFFDTPGRHQALLESSGLQFFRARGPLRSELLANLIREQGPFDALLCGEDDVDAKVIGALSPTCRVISKYGVGIDRIDVASAGKFGMLVTNTPGVNHRSVAELTFGLLLSLVRKIPEQNSAVHQGEWRRSTGIELVGKTLGIVGVGRVGREVALRGLAFGMNVIGFNSSWPKSQLEYVHELNQVFQQAIFDSKVEFKHVKTVEPLLEQADFISLHMNLTRDNQGFLNAQKLSYCRRGVFIVNVSRAALIDTPALIQSLRSGHVAGYGADVLTQEPVTSEEPLRGLPNVVITPHVGSRTVESVERQGHLAVENILRVIAPEATLGSAAEAWPEGAVCALPKSSRLGKA